MQSVRAVGATEENIATRAYWLGNYDPRPLALTRISLGLVLLLGLLSDADTLQSLLSASGPFPLAALPNHARWGLFSFVESPRLVGLLLVLTGLSTVAYIAGFYTRVASGLCWLLYISVHKRLLDLHTGGDQLADTFLFMGMFVDLGAVWSVDAVRRGGARAVHALVPRLMALLPAAMYLLTAIAKLSIGGVAVWLNGPIIYQHLQLHGWVRPLGGWLADQPTICRLMGTATIVTELLIPLLFVTSRWLVPARTLAILLHLGLQLGILLTFKVGPFTYVMFAITWLWVLPSWLTRLGLGAPPLSPPPAWTRRSLAWHVPLLALVALLLVSALDSVPLPRAVAGLLRRLGIGVTTGMFTHASPSVRWSAEGTLSSGARLDPLRVVTPDLVADGFPNSLWRQLPYRTIDSERFGRFVCTQYNADSTRPGLVRWKLLQHTRAPYLPGDVVSDEVSRVLLEMTCPPLPAAPAP